MLRTTVLDFGAAQDLGSLDFPNLEQILEQRLANTKTRPDLEKLIKLVNPFLKDGRFTQSEHHILKRLRQRAYDRKRNPKFPSRSMRQNRTAELPNIFMQNEQKVAPIMASKSSSLKATTTKKAAKQDNYIDERATPIRHANNFGQGVIRAFANIDGETLVRAIPKLSACLSAVALVSFLLWHQSLALYHSAGFSDATYAAAGGILMIIGFAAYHAITRSWLALLFCLYAGAYEGYLMISGTIHDDHKTHEHAVQTNPEIVFLQEKAEKERAHYLELKQRYENPESKVFKNEWFQKTYLNPAWHANSAANEELLAKRAALTAVSSVNHITWLKILYRLGLVFLCMMLVHHLFAHCVGKRVEPKISSSHTLV